MISKMKRCLALAVAMTVTFAGTNALGGRNSASAETYDNGGNYWGLENTDSAETGNRILVDLNHPYLTMDGVTWIIPTAAASSSWRSPVCPPAPIPSRPGTAVWVRAILPDSHFPVIWLCGICGVCRWRQSAGRGCERGRRLFHCRRGIPAKVAPWGRPTADWQAGDLSGDGRIDSVDLCMMKRIL